MIMHQKDQPAQALCFCTFFWPQSKRQVISLLFTHVLLLLSFANQNQITTQSIFQKLCQDQTTARYTSNGECAEHDAAAWQNKFEI